MSSYRLLQRWWIVACMLCLVSVPGYAQDVDVFRSEDMHGQTSERPYISYGYLQAVLIGRDDADVQTLDRGLVFQELLEVSSVDDIINMLGEPVSVDETRRTTTLNYEGARIEYYEHDGSTGVINIEIDGCDWSLTVAGTRLYPGMDVEALSPSVQAGRKAGDTSTFDAQDIDSFVAIPIAAPDSGRRGAPEMMQEGRAQFLLFANDETDVVEMIRFTRLGPW
ncbi:hypothetical protein [Longimonas halophila]|nr:hypothetical protein [Longimonas halophila]